uniref:Hedgehog/Intein (Hint) domain-containing protein n=1 Tax=viral metagenome TaxID=1070528 RepID=A0A6C0D2M3_9ZZZZ
MSIDFQDFTTLNTYVLLASANIDVATATVNQITTNTFPANYAAGVAITGLGELNGGILDDTNKSTALSQLGTLCTNIEAAITTGPTTLLPTIPTSGSITVTPGIYTLPYPPSFNFTSSQTIVCDGSGTYLFVANSNSVAGITLDGTITLLNGAIVTDIYWYTNSFSSGSLRDVTVGGYGMKGIFIQNSTNASKIILNQPTLDGCVYNNTGNVNLSAAELNSETLCFLRDTHILTNTGYKPIQNLSVGDLVLSYGSISESQIVSHSQPLFTPVKWIQHFKPSFKNSSTMPIHFQKDSLGVNIPQKDLWLSPFHGIFVEGKMTQAQQFINGTTIIQDFNVGEVEYFHFETEDHCAVDAEGVKSETFINMNYAIRNLPSINNNRNKERINFLCL